MARYWRLVNLLTDSGTLSLSEVSLYDVGTKITTVTSATVAPASGTLSLLDDGLSDVAVTWTKCSDAGFAIVLDAGVFYTIVSLRLGSGASAADYPRDLTLQTSDDLLTWTTQVSYVHATWPGALAFTPLPVAVVDPHFSKVSLLLPGNGANNSTTFVDNSLRPKAVTAGGNAKISTAQAISGGSSMFFDGIGDYLTTPSHADFDFGTGDFTIEVWVYAISVSNSPFIFHKLFSSSVVDAGWFLELTPSLIYFGKGVTPSPTIEYATFGATFPLSTWVHLAVTRVGSLLTCFLNGVLLGSVTVQGAQLSYANNAEVVIGGGGPSFYPSTHFYGHLANFEVVKGVARYTSNFTPSALARFGIGGLQVDTPSPRRLRLAAPAADRYLPAVALLDGAAKTHAREHTFFDAYNGGVGNIVGTVKEKNTPANTPLHRRVLLVDEASRITIRETWSDPITGAFEFRGVKQGVKYSTISYDHLHNYRAVIADNQDAA